MNTKTSPCPKCGERALSIVSYYDFESYLEKNSGVVDRIGPKRIAKIRATPGLVSVVVCEQCGYTAMVGNTA